MDAQSKSQPRPLFIFEMANNHDGSVEHGRTILRVFRAVADDFPEFDFGLKLQYRDREALLSPDIQARTDLSCVKRFTETSLTWQQYRLLKSEIDSLNFIPICTPWDAISVWKIVEHGYAYIKIPSCYFSDLPLLMECRDSGLPILASVAGVDDPAISLMAGLLALGTKPYSLLHCVAEYPTPDDHLNLSRIAFLRRRFPHARIGYSTHERPDNYSAVQIAIALGATIFEKHIGVSTSQRPLNSYSATPEQARLWLEAARDAYQALGSETHTQYPDEEKSLGDLRALRRALLQAEALVS